MEGGAQSFERVLSVDNLVGGLWRLGHANTNLVGGMGRTDSEAAFQEFLKRIPSASNLAAIAGSAGALDALPPSSNLLPTSTLLTELAPSTAAAAGIAAAGTHQTQAAGIHRVSSIDFLRFVSQPTAVHTVSAAYQQAGGNLNGYKTEAPAPLAPGPTSLPIGLSPEYHHAGIASTALPQHLAQAALQPVQAPVVATAPPHHALAAAHLANPAAAAAAAAALQLQGHLTTHLPRHSGPKSSHATSHTKAPSATSHSDEDENDKDETRRARRMLSNRESARRSRKRKQEHLSKLETELAAAQEEGRAATERASTLERRCQSFEEENRRLKEENERLRDELGFLRSELSERKDRNGWRRDHCMDDEDTHHAKRGRNGPQRNSASQRDNEGSHNSQDDHYHTHLNSNGNGVHRRPHAEEGLAH